MPFLGWPIIGPLFGWGVSWLAGKFFDEAKDQAEMYIIASRNVVDRIAFDNEFIKLSILAKSNPSEEQKHEALQKARVAMDKFIRIK